MSTQKTQLIMYFNIKGKVTLKDKKLVKLEIYFSDIIKQFVLDFTLFTQKKGIANGKKAGLNQKLRKLRAIVNYAKDSRKSDYL